MFIVNPIGKYCNFNNRYSYNVKFNLFNYVMAYSYNEAKCKANKCTEYIKIIVLDRTSQLKKKKIK